MFDKLNYLLQTFTYMIINSVDSAIIQKNKIENMLKEIHTIRDKYKPYKITITKCAGDWAIMESFTQRQTYTNYWSTLKHKYWEAIIIISSEWLEIEYK